MARGTALEQRALEANKVAPLLAEYLTDVGFRVQREPLDGRRRFDLLATSDHLGRTRKHFIELKWRRLPVPGKDIEFFMNQVRHHDLSAAEYWLVAPAFTKAAMHVARGAAYIRLFRLDELLGLLRNGTRPRGTNRDVRRLSGSRVVRAVSANKQSIVLMAASLAQMLDDRITELKGERPNDPDRIQAHEKTLADYEELKRKVAELQKAVSNFTATPAKSKGMQKTAGAFRTGIEDWWNKSHNAILSTTFGMSMFVLGTAICAQLGVPPGQGAYLSAALAGGGTLASAMRKLPKMGRGRD